MQIALEGPWHWQGWLDFLRYRCLAGIDRVETDGYFRLIDPGNGKQAELSVRHDAGFLTVALDGETGHADLPALLPVIKRMTGLHHDWRDIHQDLVRDPDMAPLVGLYSGLPLPSTFDPFEAMIRAICGQQVSVKAARNLVLRLIDRCGNNGFPTADAVLDANLDNMGMPGKRVETLRVAARAFRDGIVPPADDMPDADDLVASLVDLPGIGPWTANYVAMRGYGVPDAWPGGDAGLVKAWQVMKGHRPTPKAFEKIAESWRPWRSYAAILLWTWIAEQEQQARGG